MRITCLVEDTTIRGDLQAEKGLALLVERDGLRLLVDAGQTGVVVDNAAVLGCDLGSVDMVVLSHHHYDHGNGLDRFFQVNSSAPVLLRHQAPAERFYATAFGLIRRPVGLDLAMLDRHAGRFKPITGTHEITPDVVVLTEIAQTHTRPRGNRWLSVVRDGRKVPDPFDHELVLVIRDEDGLVLLSGCAHNGVLNLIETALARFPGMPIKAVIGGFHLIDHPLHGRLVDGRHEVEQLGRLLLEHQVARVITGHCTGSKAYRILQSMLGHHLEPLTTGLVIDL